MHFLLVNNNPAVSRLITLSVEKLGFEIDEVTTFDELPLESYDIVFVDNELYEEILIDDQIESGLSTHFVYISARGEDKPNNMNSVLEKHPGHPQEEDLYHLYLRDILPLDI